MTTPTNINLDERNERQRSLNLTIPQSISIIGCGGVGSWIAMFLALAGVPTLYLWDNDTISMHNLNRLPLGPTHLNANKAMALRDMLLQLTPHCNVLPMASIWSTEAQASMPTPEWIVAATDTWRSRLSIYEWSRLCNECNQPEGAHVPRDQNSCYYKLNCKYIEASAEGEYGGCTGEPATFASELEDAPGYASVPVHVGPCVTAASMVTYHILHNIQLGRANYRFGFSNNQLELQHF